MSENANLYAHFRSHFPTDLNAPLLFTQDNQTHSYADADLRSAQIATVLLSLGAVAGDRVTVQVEKSVHNLFLYFACLRAGLVYHPLNTAYTEPELRYFLDDAEPTIVVCGCDSMALVESLVSKKPIKAVLSLEADGRGTLIRKALEIEIDELEKNTVTRSKGSDMAALLYSSGTTGQPKGIMLSHDNLRTNAQTLVETWGFTASDRLLHMLPIYHVHGLFVGISCVMMVGASMEFHEKFEVETALTALPNCRVMMGVPTYYTRLLANSMFDKSSCANMRLFISGSAPLLEETFNEFKHRTGHTILERYGMTETGMNTSNPLRGERRAGTVGQALTGVSTRIVDDNGEPIAKLTTGNLQIKGANVFSGYWRMPEKTAHDFTADGFFNTGDKAKIDADGYISIIGRANDMIISGGLNVYPKEVEMVINDIDAVKESAVIGVANADFGEQVVAVVVIEPTNKSLNALSSEAIIDHCKRYLANYKIPKRIEFTEKLPRNAMSKVQKNVLRERYS